VTVQQRAPATVPDFDGDHRADLPVFRPSTGWWWVLHTGAGTNDGYGFGLSTDVPYPMDYDGDGKADLALWRPSVGHWFVSPSSGGYPSGGHPAATEVAWGLPGDVPVAADFDGDGKTDFSIFRPSTGWWWILRSSVGSAVSYGFGLSNDVPYPMDYDGDGKGDLALWRPSVGHWFIAFSSSGLPDGGHPAATEVAWGLPGDLPAAADFDGDGRTDPAVYRPGNGHWYVLPTSAPGTWLDYPFGLSADLPMPRDVDGDGKADLVIWRPSVGNWWMSRSTLGFTDSTQVSWGLVGDIPVKAPSF
jgi:hypothetical protein